MRIQYSTGMAASLFRSRRERLIRSGAPFSSPVQRNRARPEPDQADQDDPPLAETLLHQTVNPTESERRGGRFSTREYNGDEDSLSNGLID